MKLLKFLSSLKKNEGFVIPCVICRNILQIFWVLVLGKILSPSSYVHPSVRLLKAGICSMGNS